MLKIENVVTPSERQWEAIIRGMRNPMNSWDKSDSHGCFTACDGGYCPDPDCELYVSYCVRPNDLDLMTRLRNAGTDHRKFMRMITVYVDITAPLYWWKEFDTYKVGTVANSCSTMHKIHAKEFTLEDFSCEHLIDHYGDPSMNLNYSYKYPKAVMQDLINILNHYRHWYLETKDKEYWWQMIQLLPSSYNQRRTVMLNYEVLTNIYKSRKNHKLDEWCVHDTPKEHDFRNKDFSSGMWGFCDWIENLPYSELITGGKSNV